MSKILIIEDEEKIERFVELELSHEGYETDKETNDRRACDSAHGERQRNGQGKRA